MRGAPGEATLSAARGFGVVGGLPRDVAAPLAGRCAELGYSSLWATDHPTADGLGTLAALATAATDLELGVGILALDRHRPDAIGRRVDELGLDPKRLLLGVGAGFSPRPLTLMRRELPELRAALPGVRLILAALGPRMCELAGAGYDGVLVDWPTSASAELAAARVDAGAGAAGRTVPPVLGYVRAAVGADAETRLAKDEGFYRELHGGYRAHFQRLGAESGAVGVQSDREAEIGPALADYKALDPLIVRALARPKLGPLVRLAEAAAPRPPGLLLVGKRAAGEEQEPNPEGG